MRQISACLIEMHALHLTILPDGYAICHLPPDDPLPPWLSQGSFFSVTRTREELSIICPETNLPAGSQYQSGWRLLKFEGPFEFTLTGVLVSVTLPLAEAGISLLAISTYDTDYVLVQAGQLDAAIQVLTAAGHTIQTSGEQNVPQY